MTTVTIAFPFLANPENPIICPPEIVPDWLSDGAQRKLARLLEERDTARALVDVARERRTDAVEAERHARREVERLEQAYAQGRLRRSTRTGDHTELIEVDEPRLERARKGLDRATAELRHARKVETERTERWSQRGQLLQAIDQWLRSLEVSGGALRYGRVKAEPKKVETVADAIARVRRDIGELQSALRKVRTAPLPSQEAKERAREHVSQLVQERGRPAVASLLYAGSKGGRDRVQYTNCRVGFGGQGAVTDSVAFAAWLNPEGFLARLEAEIDAVAKDEDAIPLAERAPREHQLTCKLLAASREEEALIEAAAVQGMGIARRVDADPRAVLGPAAELSGAKQ